jgi:hypothetical protein
VVDSGSKTPAKTSTPELRICCVPQEILERSNAMSLRWIHSVPSATLRNRLFQTTRMEVYIRAKSVFFEDAERWDARADPLEHWQ